MVSHRPVICDLLECLLALDCKQLGVSNSGFLCLYFPVSRTALDSKFDKKRRRASNYGALTTCRCSMYFTYKNSFYLLGISARCSQFTYRESLSFLVFSAISSICISRHLSSCLYLSEGSHLCCGISRKKHGEVTVEAEGTNDECSRRFICRQMEAFSHVLLLKKCLCNELTHEWHISGIKTNQTNQTNQLNK